MEYRIRQIRRSEAGQVRNLRLRSLADAPEAMGGNYRSAERRAWARWEARTKSFARGEQSVMFVAEHPHGRLMGSGGAITTLSSLYGDVELMWMWAEPQSRQQGIAGALLTQIEKWGQAVGHARMLLECGAGNQVATSLYSRRGYTVQRNRPWPGRESDQLLVMAKAL